MLDLENIADGGARKSLGEDPSTSAWVKANFDVKDQIGSGIFAVFPTDFVHF